MEIEKNMLRNRSKGLNPISDEMWGKVCRHNRDLVKEFLDSNKHLSNTSLKQYKSALRQFFYFIFKELDNKPMYKITKRNFIKYFSFLQENNLSSSALKLKKSAVSALCIYIENIIAEEEEDYENFRNFTKAIKDIPTNRVYNKLPMTIEEYEKCVEYLLEKEKYLGLAWLSMAFYSGARKKELRQFKTEIVNYEKKPNQNFYETHIVYGKGRAGGKPIKYMFNDEAMKYAKLWVDNRDYESEYLFSTKYKGKINEISDGWANDFCQNVLSKICMRRINPHILRASACTRLLQEGKDFKAVSKLIMHHSNSDVTGLYDLRDDDEAKNTLFE